MKSIVTILSLVIILHHVDSWVYSVPSIQHSRNRLNRNKLLSTQESELDIIDEVKPKAEYGVSYIGGDPCGSKYNTDPFDAQVAKPGMPDDMKSRIQALADKKIKEMKAAAEKEE